MWLWIFIYNNDDWYNVSIGRMDNDTTKTKDSHLKILSDFREGKTQILVGTPEKICEIAVNSGLLNLANVKTFVIDEADMTLEMGFLNEVDKVASLCKNAQMMVFSATIPAGIKHFIKKYFKSPLVIEDEKQNYNEQIEHILYPTRGKNKNELLVPELCQ